MEKDTYQAGDRVWFRGRFADGYSVRGVVARVLGHEDPERVVYDLDLENGNTTMCRRDQLRSRA